MLGNERWMFTVIQNCPCSFSVVRMEIDEYTDRCSAGGIRMHGLHATVAPRRQNQQKPPTLEGYHFVPYISSEPVCDKELGQYMSVCTKVASNYLNKLHGGQISTGKNSLFKAAVLVDSDICAAKEEFLAQPKSELLTHLVSICACGENEKPQHMNFSNDRLVQHLMQPEVLKPCLDIVIENSTSHTLKVVEMEGSENRVYRHAVPLLLSHPMMKVNYVVVDSSEICASGDDCEKYQIVQEKWDGIDMKGFAKNHQSTNLVIAKQFLHKHSNLEESIFDIASMVGEGGFILVEEVIQNFGLTEAMESSGIDAGSSAFCYRDAAKLKDIFEKSGLEIVYERSDLLSAIFLLRKRSMGVLDSQTILHVEDLNCSWVEELKQQLKAIQSKPKGDNLWIVATSAAVSGLIGLVNCLRREEGGDRIRYWAMLHIPYTVYREFFPLGNFDENAAWKMY